VRIDLLRALQEVVHNPEPRSSTRSGDAASQLIASILDSVQRDRADFAYEMREALIDLAGQIDRVSIAVTGLAWLGAGVPSVEQEMLSLVKSAQREIALCAYSITTGAATLLQEIKDVVTQGVNATIVVNALEEQPASVRRYLKSSAQELPDRWRVLDFARRADHADLHAKLLIVDRSAALIGSANLSSRGMVSNHEIAVVVRGPTAEAIAARFDMLIRSASVR
jgi:phosphatidylserine/phosphatidylglycerophosphate/cardiolipin synthase-like enzyme